MRNRCAIIAEKSNKRGPGGPSCHSCQSYSLGFETSERMRTLILCLLAFYAAAKPPDNGSKELLVEGIFLVLGLSS